MWPNCFPTLPEEYKSNEVHRLGLGHYAEDNIWWEEYRDGTDPDTGIKWRATITMQYENFAQAVNGRVAPLDDSVEISIRTWSTESGKGPWNPRLVQISNHWYQDLSLMYEKRKDGSALCM